MAAVSSRPSPRLDRQFWLAILVAAVVVIPRTALVSRAHSNYWDDQFHLACGLSFLYRTDPRLYRNDPPLGQGLLALPMILTGSAPESPQSWYSRPHPPSTTPPFVAVLFGHRLLPETLSLIIAVWKAVLFLPFAGLVFHWCRSLYGLASGWLGLILILFEPTIAGHVAPAALDVLGAEAILFASYFAWRYFRQPSRGGLVVAAVTTAAALLTKHTAVLLPAIIAAYGVAWRIGRRPADVPRTTAWRRLANELLAIGLVAIVSLWPLTLFDVSPPARHGPVIRTRYTQEFSFGADVINASLERRWPAGIYIGSIRSAQEHAKWGHPAFLLGQRREGGWWYYYPVVAAYKVPIPVAILFVLAIVSLWNVRPRWEELALVIPAIGYAIFLCVQSIDIGFRHFLPAYVPMLMFASRSLGTRNPELGTESARTIPFLTPGCRLLATLLILDSTRTHPDYLSYTNVPGKNVHLAISDSNLDWGQSLKQVRQWIDANPTLIRNRPIYLTYFGDTDGDPVSYYLGGRVIRFDGGGEPLPASGVLIASPVHVADVYDHFRGVFDPIRRAESEGRLSPVTIIGHCMRVYDLDVIDARK
jgi:hypothetical protein